jgi:hypothetical protein
LRNTLSSWLAATASLLGIAAAPQAQALELLVPAYFYPAGQGATYWNQMVAAAAKAPIVAILNPNSGPGTAVDPSYVDVATRLRASGGRVVGYVHTSYATRPLADVTQEILMYQSMYPIDGFFVDEIANDGTSASVIYYAALYDYIKALDPSYRVIGNPGTKTAEIYISRPTADAVVVFEDSARTYRRYAPDAWNFSYPAARFGHLVYAAADSATMRTTLNYAQQRNAGLVYVTNDKLQPNPWDTLPAYWNSLVTEVCLRNGGTSVACQ